MYSHENFARVRERIEKRRQTALDTAEAHNLEVRERSPEIREIDSRLTRTGLLLFRTACEGGDLSAVRAENEALMARRRELLRSLGYPEDYTEPHYTCPRCGDTGYVDTRMCSCLHDELIREGIRSSGMGKLLERQTFDNFSLEWYRDPQDPDAYRKMDYALRMAKDFAADFRENRRNLLLMGPTGTGKTHLSTAIANEVIRQGFDVLYDSTQNILRAFETDQFHREDLRRERGVAYEPQGDKYLTCDLLILDDLGAEFTNSFTVSVLYNLLNTRQNAGLSTILSTNLDIAGLTRRYEDRIYSRLIGSDFIVLQFSGRDHRLFH